MNASAEPTAIGPFTVLRKIGEGGMGVVYAGLDVALDRRVALKLIRRQFLDSVEVRARMIREAQAMARLSHPNVVQVYQVGEYGDQIYLAMEYVEGQTMTGWLREAPRSWPQVLRVAAAAGRGLAAAHAVGMVHRDFKPDNVLVGTDGRVCVADFGLVHAEGAAVALGVGASAADEMIGTFSRVSTIKLGSGVQSEAETARLTQAGVVLGTPAYMSPEQHFGEVVSAASDQFSFGVAVYEALYGGRPFAALTRSELHRQLKSGKIPLPPRSSNVPRRIFRIIARSLALSPGMRWRTLAEMIDALERDPRRTVVRTVGVVAVAVAAATGSYMAAILRHDADRCKGAEHDLADTWGETRASAMKQAFAATGVAYAMETWQRVQGRLDAYAVSWVDEHKRSCEAHVSGMESARLFELRARCLARRKAHLAELVEVFVAADRSVLENAVQAVAALPDVDSCRDADALLAAVAPPDDAEIEAQVESLRGRLARASALEGTGQYALGLDLIGEVRADAEKLQYKPLMVEVALVEGSLLMAVARDAEAETALTEALRSGLALGLDVMAAEATAKRIFVIGYGQGRREAALDGEAVAMALAERAHDPRVTALLHNNLGVVLAEAKQADRARTQYLKAIELLEQQGTVDPLIAAAHHNLGGLELDLNRLDEAREQYDQGMRLWASLLGDNHPLVAHALGGMAEVDEQAGRDTAAAEGYVRVLSLMEAAYGEGHIYLLQPLVGLGRLRVRGGDVEAARGLFGRAVAIGEALGTAHPMYAEALVELAGVVAAEDVARAQVLFERALTATAGREEAMKEHGTAALGLARVLGATQAARACGLLVTAQAELAEEERRREAAELYSVRCAGAR